VTSRVTPRGKQLNVELSERTLKRLALLCEHYGCTRIHLIERLIDDAAVVAKAEVAARAAMTRQEPSLEDEAEEMDAEVFRSHRARIDHI